MASKLTRKRKKYHPPYEEPMDETRSRKKLNETHTQGDIAQRAIASAKKHNINLKPGRANRGAGNCSYESVVYNINDRNCFREKLPLSPDAYRRIWTTDMMNRILDKTCTWNPGLTKRQLVDGFTIMMDSGVYEVEFFGDMIMPGIACGIRKRILIFITNENIVTTGHNPIAVIDPTNYGGQLDDDTPVVVAYNLVHYESLHPVHNDDIEETIKLTNAYIALPSRYEELYGFVKEDISYLVSSSPREPTPERGGKQETWAEVVMDLQEVEGPIFNKRTDSVKVDDKFLFVKGNIKFEEI